MSPNWAKGSSREARTQAQEETWEKALQILTERPAQALKFEIFKSFTSLPPALPRSIFLISVKRRRWRRRRAYYSNYGSLNSSTGNQLGAYYKLERNLSLHP